MPPIRPDMTVPVWADAGDRTRPDPFYIQHGFPYTNDKPTRQTMNWVLNYATNGVQYMMSRGIPEFDLDQGYSQGDVVRFGSRFYSAKRSTVGNLPSNTQDWDLWYTTADDLNGNYTPLSTFNATRDSLQAQITALGSGPGPGPSGPADWNTLVNRPTWTDHISWSSADSKVRIDTTLWAAWDVETNHSLLVYAPDGGRRLEIRCDSNGNSVLQPTVGSVVVTSALVVGGGGSVQLNSRGDGLLQIHAPVALAGVSSSGDLATSTNVTCNGIYIGGLYWTNESSWMKTPSGVRCAGLETGNIGASNIVCNNLTANSSITTNTGQINGTLTVGSISAGSLGASSIVANGGQVNGNLTVAGTLNAASGQINGNLTVGGALTATVNMSGLSELRFDAGVVYARGYRGRQGLGGPFAGNDFNWWWDGAHVHAHIDYTNVGWIQLQQASDYRLKDNVEPITDALSLVMRLRPVFYNWGDIPETTGCSNHGTRHAGLIAHEVQEVFPGAIEGAKDAVTADGKIEPQHVNEFDFIALLTRAMQELAERLSILEEQHGISN